MGYAFFVLMLITALMLIPFSGAACAGAADGLRLFALNVLPSLFPFFVCAHYMTGAGITPKLKRSGGALVFCCCSVMTAICGTPSAALLCRGFYERGELSRRGSSLLCAVLNQTGPVFIVSTLASGFLGQRRLAWAFAISHYIPPLLAASLSGLFIKPSVKSAGMESSFRSSGPFSLFSRSVSDAVTTSMRVGGTIVFFRVVHSVMLAAGVFSSVPPVCGSVMTGLLEMTNGVELLCADPVKPSLCLCAFLLSFGGVCIFIQSRMIFPELSAGVYFPMKLALGAVSSLIFLLVYPLFSGSAASFGSGAQELTRGGMRAAAERSAAVVCFSATAFFTMAASAILVRTIRRK